MKSKLKPAPKFIALFGAGVFLLVAGLVAGHWFPIIKHIWTSSFALFVGGLSFLLLSFFYLLIDVIGFKKWSFFFVVIGANALAVYCFTELVNPYVGKFVEYVYFHAGIIFAAPIGIGSFALLWYILYVMYKKQIFIKV